MDPIVNICKKYSMLSDERLMLNIQAVDSININKINGDIVEIGVWKGGSMLSMMLAHEKFDHISRNFHLYDTFEGMTPSTDEDVDYQGKTASVLVQTNLHFRCISSLAEVKNNIKTLSNIANQCIHYHVGDILKNKVYPEKIAILRLDTDWYESTKFELNNFYDKVVSGGYVIIDDYGWWNGCKKAVDEFLVLHPGISLTKIDFTGVYFIKP